MVIETTDPITGIVVGPEIEIIIEMGIGTIIDQTTEGVTVTKGMETEIRTTVGLERGIEIGVVQEEAPNPEVEINLIIGIRVEMIIGDRVEIIPEIDLKQGQDQVPM